MNSIFALVAPPLRIAAMVVGFVLLAPFTALSDCSEEELTAVFILDNIYSDPTVAGGPDSLAGRFQTEDRESGRQAPNGVDLSRDTVSYWSVDTFNCANLDPNTPDNQAWWCGTQFEACSPDDPPEGYGNSWNQRLVWQGTVLDPNEPVTVTVRALLNLDSEPTYDYFHLQCLTPDGVRNLWSLDGFAEGLMVDETFTLQPEDFFNPFDAVHLRWTFRSDGGWSDEDCAFPSAGAVQIDMIEVFFDQGEGPVQMGETETCEPGSELQWVPEVDDLRLVLLDVAPLGTVTNPSIPEMIEAVLAVEPNPYNPNYEHWAQAGPFHLFIAAPSDFGAYGIVDGRDGRVAFAGTVVWAGLGSVTFPVESSHGWSFPPIDPATEPASVELLTNPLWPEGLGPPAEITDKVLGYLRGSDVLRSFSDCGAYDVVSFIYFPGVGWGDPEKASLIVMVSGKCGPPWADFVTAAPSVSSDRWLTGVNPNPFNPVTVLSLDIPRESQVKLAIYSIDGKLVKVLADRIFLPGRYSIPWSGLGRLGERVGSGPYLARISAPGYSQTVPITLLK